MSIRILFSAVFFGIGMFVFADAMPVYADTAQGTLFAGQVSALSPCLTVPNGVLVSVKNAGKTVSFVYIKGFSRGAMPLSGDTIYGIAYPGQSCFSLSLASSKNSIFLYATTTPDQLSARTNLSSPSASFSTATLSGLSSGFTSLLSSGLSLLSSSGQQSSSSSLISQATSLAGGAAGLGMFGGVITPITVCNVGILYTVAGVPYSGPLMWMPGASAVPPYLYALGSPPAPGFIIGHYSKPVPCVVGVTTIMIAPLMTGYGTSVP